MIIEQMADKRLEKIEELIIGMAEMKIRANKNEPEIKAEKPNLRQVLAKAKKNVGKIEDLEADDLKTHTAHEIAWFKDLLEEIGENEKDGSAEDILSYVIDMCHDRVKYLEKVKLFGAKAVRQVETARSLDMDDEEIALYSQFKEKSSFQKKKSSFRGGRGGSRGGRGRGARGKE